MAVFLVSHFHWDREWYRTMQAFRARLVDAVDAVLDLAEADAGYRFVLDGQAIVLEDYLAVRPERSEDLRRHVEAGRLAVGPWYVQPDALLPSGESHVRNLLIGRAVARRFGAVSSVAYLPDSFGHPAQMPEIFRGFDLDGFVYWRGNGNEIEELGSRWRWRAPSGATLRALHLSEGYFNAARMGADVGSAAARLEEVVDRLAQAGEVPVVLMNGFDHTGPDTNTAATAAALAKRLDQPVVRALLDDVLREAPGLEDLPEYSGDLAGARLANLLPGVWSARLPLKVRNRRVEMLLQRWAEPWAALGRVLGLADERPALDLAWRSLLQNQAHDSICGCSTDETHARMTGRYDDAEGLATQTTARLLERVAGREPNRAVPWAEKQVVAVFNPSPHERSDWVRVALDGDPALAMSVGEIAMHPLALAAAGDGGYAVGGNPARLIESDDPTRVRWLPDQRAMDLEFVAERVPAFGYATYTVEPATRVADEVDGGSEIVNDLVRLSIAGDGTVDASFGGDRLSGLFALEDVGDAGDSYDHEPVGVPVGVVPTGVELTRRRHVSGMQSVLVRRHFETPARLDGGRRSPQRCRSHIDVELSLAPGVERIDARVTLDNGACDHRLRMLFPTTGPASLYRRATTFDISIHDCEPVDDRRWVHPAPRTFCHQGWIEANGLWVVAPGLPEAEVMSDGTIAVTLVRSVGWLARFEMAARPLPAGPMMAAPGAQCLRALTANLSLMWRADAIRAGDAEAGLWGVLAGPRPLFGPGKSLVSLEGEGIVLSALKPADDGRGIIVRLSNPGGEDRHALLRFGFPVSSMECARLDEVATMESVCWDGESASVTVAAHGLKTLRVHPGE